jgi:hypothetical protein
MFRDALRQILGEEMDGADEETVRLYASARATIYAETVIIGAKMSVKGRKHFIEMLKTGAPC